MINVIFNDPHYEIMPKRKEMFDKYCKILQWGRRHPTRFAEQFFNLQLTDHQKWLFLNSWIPSTNVWVCSRSTGKCLALNTRVYPVIRDRVQRDGKELSEPHTIGELKVGDWIYDETGNPVQVLRLNHVIIDDEYIITFEDGEEIHCNDQHLWYVYDRDFDRNGRYEDKWVLRDTEFMSECYDRNKNNKGRGWRDYRFHVPLSQPLQYPKITHYGTRTIDPYVLGVWLGDGSKSAPHVASGGLDVDEMKSLIESKGYYVKKDKECNKDNTYALYIDRQKDLEDAGIDHPFFVRKLRNLGVLNNKHIPPQYLYAPVEDRIALLQGLMDTDGTVDETGGCEFTQTNKRLFDDVCQLVASLGIMATPFYKEHTGYIKKDGTEADTWRLYFKVSKNIIPAFKLKRKLDRQREDVPVGTNTKAIIKIEKTGKKIPMRCITVSNKSGLFLCGEKYTVTHNSYMASIFLMLKSILFPHFNSFIMAPSGDQAKATFTKMENLAKNNIASAVGVTRVFIDECVRQNAKADPFTHNANGYEVNLYNGSRVTTLNSVAKNIVGVRSFILWSLERFLLKFGNHISSIMNGQNR